MEESTFMAHLPRMLKIGTSLNINTGQWCKWLISCRFLTGAALLVLSFQELGSADVDGSGEGKYAKYHDLLIILILTVSEATFIKGKKHILLLVRYLLKPPFHGSKPIPLEISRRFLRLVNIFGAIVSAVFAVSVAWALTPLLPFVTHDTNPKTLHFPFHWIPACSESFVVVMLAAAAAVFYILSGLLHFFTWYPTIAYCAIKMKLMVKLLAVDVELVDEKAEQLARATLSFILRSGGSPFCAKCSDPPKPSADRSLGKAMKLEKLEWRECCMTEAKSTLKTFYVNKSLDRIVEMHVEIIRFVRLVDTSFQLSVLMYNQFAIVAAVLLVPKISSVQSMTGSEIIIVVFEVVGVLSTVGLFNFCGQIVLNESEEIRVALHRGCRWYDWPLSTRRRLLIMLTAATRPLRLTSGGIHTLSNETYSTILSAAYSYASVLQSLKGSGK